MDNDDLPAEVRLSAGLGALVERLLKYSDIRRNDPRENREVLRDLIVGELADELQAVRGAERERCITAVFAWAHDAIDRHAGATFSAPTAAEQIAKRL